MRDRGEGERRLGEGKRERREGWGSRRGKEENAGEEGEKSRGPIFRHIHGMS